MCDKTDSIGPGTPPPVVSATPWGCGVADKGDDGPPVHLWGQEVEREASKVQESLRH